ncbi:Zn-ribbon domain-containing OB-fold protein [Chloroflexota bacterium]
MACEKPIPKPNADNKAFWDGCKQHQLRFQKCQNCGLVRWPPSLICPNCHSQDAEWLTASGKGKVYSFAVYHQAYHPAFENDLPYVTAIIQLTEGPCILSNIVGCNPEDIKCDMPVVVTWDDITAEFSLPKFKPVQ